LLKAYYIKKIQEKEAENERNFESKKKVIEQSHKRDLETLEKQVMVLKTEQFKQELKIEN
jgi:hypothetical protein